MIYVILILVYVASAIMQWRYVHFAHSKGGIWENVIPQKIDVFTVLCPLINTILALDGWLTRYPIKKTCPFDYLKFFNVKK